MPISRTCPVPARSADPLSRAAFEAATAEHAASISAVIAHLDAEIAVLAGVDKPSVDAATPSPRRVGTAGQSTRIAACLGVKDEIELIEPAIAHLRAIDVDFILACDAYSTDGTYEILKEYQSDGEFALLQGDARQLDAFHLWEHALAGLVSKAGCDWIVFLDADEFLTPASGSLKDCVDLEWADVLSIARFNVPLGSARPTMPDLLTPEAYQELLLLVNPIPGFRTYLQTHSDVPWIMGVPHPKLMARPGRIAGLKVGWHDLAATKGNEPLRRAHPTDRRRVPAGRWAVSVQGKVPRQSSPAPQRAADLRSSPIRRVVQRGRCCSIRRLVSGISSRCTARGLNRYLWGGGSLNGARQQVEAVMGVSSARVLIAHLGSIAVGREKIDQMTAAPPRSD